MTEKGRHWLIFEVGPDFFSAVNLDCVAEIVPAVSLSPLPNAGRFVDGLANIRGVVIPIVNMRRVFQLEDRPITYSDHLLIVKTSRGQLLGLRVDRAVELADLELCSDDRDRSDNGVVTVPYISGVAKHNGRLILLHDPKSLFTVVTDRASKQTKEFSIGFGLQEVAS